MRLYALFASVCFGPAPDAAGALSLNPTADGRTESAAADMARAKAAAVAVRRQLESRVRVRVRVQRSRDGQCDRARVASEGELVSSSWAESGEVGVTSAAAAIEICRVKLGERDDAMRAFKSR